MEQDHYINSINLNQDTNFPYLVLNVINENSFPRNPGFQVMHWHEDLQFIYVLSGSIEVVTLDTRTQLRAGEGIFLNKNVVHLVRKMGSCHYNSFIFPDRFLKFYPGGPAETMVDQLVGKENLPIFKFENREEHRSVLQTLQELSALEAQKTALYPYEVLTTLCTLWLGFSRIAATPQAHANPSPVKARMIIFLRYIEQHYPDAITLDALAESAHVSRSECLRCFHTALQTAPYQYLMEYRLSRAAELLRNTDLAIGEVAARVGFGQLSHFGKCFKEKTGVSPSIYRKQNR